MVSKKEDRLDDILSKCRVFLRGKLDFVENRNAVLMLVFLKFAQSRFIARQHEIIMSEGVSELDNIELYQKANVVYVPEGCFSCNFLHVGRDKVLPVALNRDNSEKIVSSNYYVFKFRENPYILKEFFFILLLSDDIDKYFSYYTEASVRDRVDLKTFCDTKLRVPSLEEQEKIVCVYEALRENIGIFYCQTKLFCL